MLRGGSDDDVVRYFSLLAGGRYLNLREDLTVGQSGNVLGTGIAFFDGQPLTAGGSLLITDDFHTLNQFYGGQVGAQAGLVWWRFTLRATGKIALGSMREEAIVSGSTSATSPLIGSQTVNGGVLAAPSNIGTYARGVLAFLPEGNLNCSLEITPQIRLTLGYTFLYVSNVARPGELIDLGVNRTNLPSSQTFNPAAGGPQRPGFSFQGTDFWAQGINAGIWLRF